MPRFSTDTLTRAAVQRLIAADVPEQTARAVVDHMLTADLWGRATHGLSVRFPGVLRQAEQGIGSRPLKIVEDRESSILVDAHNGFGYAAGAFCADLLVERASAHGLASVALRNTTHTGMLGYYADRGARAGVVTLGFAHCRPMMAPYGGQNPLLGTNPITFGFPADPDPILVDMSTSAVAYGTILVHRKNGTPLPAGCALDSAGNPTTDPEQAAQGSLLPFGEHRGGALAVAVQLLSGVFTGAGVFPLAGEDYGLLLIGLSKGLFAGEEGYERSMREFADRYRNIPSCEGCEVRLPGSRRYGNDRDELDISDELARILEL